MGITGLFALTCIAAGLMAMKHDRARKAPRLPNIAFTEADLHELLPPWALTPLTLWEADELALELMLGPDELVGELSAEGYGL